MRICVLGDIGGHLEVFETALEAAGVDVRSRRVPDDLIVIQVGDLVHKGPDDAGCVALADDLLHGGRYVQLWGNHDAHYVGGPDVRSRPGVVEVDANTRAVFQRWWHNRTALLAVALDTDERGEVLVTHGGLTVGLWERLGCPVTASSAAAALNALLSDPSEAFRPGWLMTGTVDRSAGVTCPRTGTELAGPWLDAGTMPFDQIHGHEGTWWWPGLRFHDDCSPSVAAATSVDHERRFCWVDVGDHQLFSVDWVLGVSAPEDVAWAPLVMHGNVAI